nr:PREDICTED: A disintegrin and metalloproteinase with thrombospondin motifs 16-like isoform X1 [Linepithema humile]XP_012229703.1 PREDICTED: A disintegrin and metalloproteinase with thrombospondin motifs 16-like isoform X1 [Linepithema humile]
MFFISKLVLIIILLIETYANITQDVEKILLPEWNPRSADEIPLTLNVFGKEIQLKLRRNEQIVSSMFKVWKHDTINITEKLLQINASDPCYYLHKDHISTAAINFCQEHGWEGIVYLKDDILEIRPLRDDFASLSSIGDVCVKDEINISFGKPHLIKRSLQLSADSSFHNFDNFKMKRRHIRNTLRKLTIELAVFIDEKTYRKFLSFFDEDKKLLRSMILAYVNRIQAMFQHSSLGVSFDISLVCLEIVKKRSLYLPVKYNVYSLLDSFCQYAAARNPSDDDDPRHWDIGLYLTELDYSMTAYGFGYSYTDGMCQPNISCAIINFSITPGLSLGFISSLIAAHEIGHVLGMLDNSLADEKTEYVMPPQCDPYLPHSYGQPTWSECNRDTIEKLWNELGKEHGKNCLRDRTTPEKLERYDHSRYHNLPGKEWTAKAQCELYFGDKNANVVSLHDVCKMLQCETSHKDESTFTGPALEGTYCAVGKECRGGECVPVLEPPYILSYCDVDNWSKWKISTCKSNCLKDSKGVRHKRRFCKHGSRRTASCGEPYYDMILCDDSKLCNFENRTTISEFALAKCIEFNNVIKHLKFNIKEELEMEPGFQNYYNVNEPWLACTIHCKRKNLYSFYAPRFEMLSVGIDPYFPDGTLCHYENSKRYYCRQHYCLPESYDKE